MECFCVIYFVSSDNLFGKHKGKLREKDQGRVMSEILRGGQAFQIPLRLTARSSVNHLAAKRLGNIPINVEGGGFLTLGFTVNGSSDILPSASTLQPLCRILFMVPV